MLNKKSIRGRLGLLFLAFVLLVSFSVGATYWGIATQRQDGVIINLAGRQRMLTQKMTWLALAQPENPELSTSIELFSQSLQALQYGGETTDSSGNIILLPPAPDSDLNAQLNEVTETWQEFSGYLEPVDTSTLPIVAPLILDQLDAVVTAFEARAEVKHLRLELIQVGFWIAAIALLVWGFIDTRQMIVKPLSDLGKAAQKIGEGYLDWPLPLISEEELGELTQTFDNMRKELAQSRKKLETQVLQRTRELVTAFEFSQEIVAQRDLDELMSSVVERARLLMQAEAAALCILLPNEDILELASYSGDVDIDLGTRKPIEQGLAQKVINANQAVVSETHCTNCKFLLANNPGHCVATSLRAGKHTLGAICVVQADRENTEESIFFDKDGQRALNLLANSAAVAISNTRLAKAERQKAKQTAAFAEREQLAADLHDNLAQILSFTRIKLERLDEVLVDKQSIEERVTLKEIEKAIETAYQQVRDALTGLLGPHTTGDDFAKKLATSVDSFSATYAFPVKLEITDSSALTLPLTTQTQIIHIVGEALSNAQRHSHAKEAWVRVNRVNGHARFTIEDNGKGFDTQSPQEGNHFGLRIMQARIERSGGEFSLSSQPGKGTEISAKFPIKKSQKNDSQNPGEKS